jgi:hypothetical protein
MSQKELETQEGWEEEMARVRAELEQVRAQKAELERQREAERQERTIREALAAAGPVDAEATALLVRQRMETGGETDAARVIEGLKKEKPHLFARPGGGLPPRTGGVRQRPGEDASPLHAAAKRAAQSGTARDLLEYLRLRRQQR